MGMFDKLRASNRAYAKGLAVDRRSDYRIAQSQLDALSGNVMTTQNGIARRMDARNAAVVDRMNQLAARAGRQGVRSVNRAQAKATNLFGAGIGGQVQNDLMTARATGKATGTLSAADAKAGATDARAGSQAMGIQQSATKEAGSSADYALANALAYRAKNDAQLIAQKQEAMQQARLGFAQQKAMARFQQRLDQKSATGPGGAAYQSAAQTLMSAAMAPGATPDSIAAQASALAGAANLSPEATAQLAQYGASLFDENGQSTLSQPAGATLAAPDKALVQSQVTKWFETNADALNNSDPSKRPTFQDLLNSISIASTDPAAQADAEAYAYALWQSISPAWQATQNAINNPTSPAGGPSLSPGV